MLRNGSLGRRLPTEKVLTLTSGSQAEGLAMDRGYTGSDLDEMRMYGRSLHFTVPGDAEAGVVGSVLVMRTEGCPPGFCRIEAVGDLDENIHRVAETVPWNEQKALTKEKVKGCFERDAHGRHWLLSGRIHRALLPRMSEDTIDKPTWGNDLMEMAATFIGSAPLPSVHNFLNRRRDGDWPRQPTLDLIGQLPALIVCKPHTSNPSQTFRCSWSHIEILLSDDMPNWVKQAYRAFKYIIKGRLDLSRLIHAAETTATGKDFLDSLKNVTPRSMSVNVQDDLKRMLDLQAGGAPENGETRFSSFFLKTVLLHCLEESASVGEQGDAFPFLLILSIKLRKTLKAGHLSNYFLPDFNLFENLHAGDRAVVLEAVSDIWLDPIMTIVRSLRYPGKLYDGGDDLHGKLVDVMKTNLDHERTAADRDSLMVLLQRLDEACRVVAEPSLVSLMPWPLYEKVWLISSILARFLAIIWKVIL